MLASLLVKKKKKPLFVRYTLQYSEVFFSLLGSLGQSAGSAMIRRPGAVRIKGLAQGPTIGSLTVLRLDVIKLYYA